ncbi:hypothetical protein [Sutcliffiella horikoshii]|uniref:hypothetical protein n=1 Tax=Sutcliffiella horikoshii TaxID=79883 RepID=UPI00384B4176
MTKGSGILLNPYKFILPVVLLISYRVMIDIIYVIYLQSKWEYMGFYLDINNSKLLVSYLLFIIIVLIAQFLNKGLSSLIIFSLLLFYYTPISCLYPYMNLNNKYIIISTLAFVIMIVYNLNFSSRKKVMNFSSLNRDNVNTFHLKPYAFILAWFIVIFSMIILTIYNYQNISIANVLNLQNVYEVRSNLIYPLGTNYLYSWSTKVILPVFIYMYYVNNQKTKLTLTVFIQVWFYLLTGHKLILFAVLIVLVVIKFNRYIFNNNSIKNLLILVNASLVFSIIEIIVNSNSVIVDYLLRRALYVPALLTNYYQDYTQLTGFRYWKDSLFGRVLGVEDEILPSYSIGELYLGKSTTNAVTGFLGSEYLNLGFLGVLFAVIFIIFLVKIINIYEAKIGQEIIFISMIGPLYTLWNSALLTSILTGGIIIALFLLSKIKLKTKNDI